MASSPAQARALPSRRVGSVNPDSSVVPPYPATSNVKRERPGCLYFPSPAKCSSVIVRGLLTKSLNAFIASGGEVSSMSDPRP